MANTAYTSTTDRPAPVDAPATDPSVITDDEPYRGDRAVHESHFPKAIKFGLVAVGVGATAFVFARRRARRQKTRLERLAATGSAAVDRARETLDTVRPKVEATVEAIRPKVGHLAERAHDLLPTG